LRPGFCQARYLHETSEKSGQAFDLPVRFFLLLAAPTASRLEEHLYFGFAVTKFLNAV
jgi:hypothetical protein